MTIQCAACEGYGHVEVATEYVTEDMASDAGVPELVGFTLGPLLETCVMCDGAGLVDDAFTRLMVEKHADLQEPD